jgi:hypothetical protein
VSRSVFRFLGSGRRAQYGVHRGDEHVGFVTKIVHRHTERGVTRTIVAGWTPSTPDGRDLATVKTREAAARILWSLHQQEQR